MEYIWISCSFLFSSAFNDISTCCNKPIWLKLDISLPFTEMSRRMKSEEIPCCRSHVSDRMSWIHNPYKNNWIIIKKKTLNNSKYKNCIHVKNFNQLNFLQIFFSLSLSLSLFFKIQNLTNVFLECNSNILFIIIDSVQRESTMDSHYTIHLLGVLSGE
jgi:hypothetical protein